jgi:hypothetical protein
MLDIPLQEVIDAHTDALTAHAEGFLPMIRFLLLQRSGLVSPDRLAIAMHWTPSEGEAFLHASGLVIDDRGTIQTVAGSGCALDTLLFSMLTGHATPVVRTCPATGKQIRLTVTPQGIEDLDPQCVVLSLRLPSLETNAWNAGETICAYGHFFVDQEHASTWPGLHSEAVLLSVEDAVHLAREIANTARRYAEKTQVGHGKEGNL